MNSIRRIDWPEIHRKAKQIPRISTNPASFHASGYKGILVEIAEHKGENKD